MGECGCEEAGECVSACDGECVGEYRSGSLHGSGRSAKKLFSCLGGLERGRELGNASEDSADSVAALAADCLAVVDADGVAALRSEGAAGICSDGCVDVVAEGVAAAAEDIADVVADVVDEGVADVGPQAVPETPGALGGRVVRVNRAALGEETVRRADARRHGSPGATRVDTAVPSRSGTYTGATCRGRSPGRRRGACCAGSATRATQSARLNARRACASARARA
eukprot:3517268-Pleurochrysis_carterae.AAC.1